MTAVSLALRRRRLCCVLPGRCRFVVIVVFIFGERAPAGGYQPAFTWRQYVNLAGARRQRSGNTLTLAPLGTLLCLLVAYPMAYFLALKVDPNAGA